MSKIVVRSQEEILARIETVRDDFLGFRFEVLASALDYEHAKRFLKQGVSESEWEPIDPDSNARSYLEFAIGKILDHSGISASRSVDKLGEYAWLLGRDDVVAAMAAEDYPQYGAPKVKAFAVGMGWLWPKNPELARMSEGLPCHDDCYSGCGS